MTNPPRTVRCECKSYSLKFVKRIGEEVHYRCTKCHKKTIKEYRREK